MYSCIHKQKYVSQKLCNSVKQHWRMEMQAKLTKFEFLLNHGSTKGNRISTVFQIWKFLIRELSSSINREIVRGTESPGMLPTCWGCNSSEWCSGPCLKASWDLSQDSLLMSLLLFITPPLASLSPYFQVPSIALPNWYLVTYQLFDITG